MACNKLIICALLLSSCSSLIIAAQLDVSLKTAYPSAADSSTEVPTEVEKKTTTTPKTTTTESTTISTSTTTTTTTTTAQPDTTTTTTSTTTTTAKPDTTTTTTAKPDTTTTPPPKTTTPAPAPYPDPQVGTWNSSCVMIKMAAQLNFTYVTKDNKNATALYNIPKDAWVEDKECGMTDSLDLAWGNTTAPDSMALYFSLKDKAVQLFMIRILLTLTPDRFPDAKENETIQLIHRGFDFTAPQNMSYHCTRSQVFNLTETINTDDYIGILTVHDVQVEAFRPTNATDFSSVHDCDSSETSDIVPIAVGIALAALIAIVLVAYLCARRRSTSRGYMSF